MKSKKCNCSTKSPCTPSKAGWKLQSLRKFIKNKKKTKHKTKHNNTTKNNMKNPKSNLQEQFQNAIKDIYSSEKSQVRFSNVKP